MVLKGTRRCGLGIPQAQTERTSENHTSFNFHGPSNCPFEWFCTILVLPLINFVFSHLFCFLWHRLTLRQKGDLGLLIKWIHLHTPKILVLPSCRSSTHTFSWAQVQGFWQRDVHHLTSLSTKLFSCVAPSEGCREEKPLLCTACVTSNKR